MATISDVVQEIVSIVGDVSGITKSHEYPRDSINQNLQAVTYPRNILWAWGETFNKKVCRFDVVVDVMTTISDGPRAVEALVPLCDTIPAALYADPRLNEKVLQWGTCLADMAPREDNGQMMLRVTVREILMEDDV